MRRRILIGAVAMAACLVVLAPSAWAVDCAREVEAAEQFLAELDQQAGQAREANRPRIRAFLDDGRKLLKEARAQCEAAQTDFARAEAVAKVAVAQGNLAAARIFIKLD